MRTRRKGSFVFVSKFGAGDKMPWDKRHRVSSDGGTTVNSITYRPQQQQPIHPTTAYIDLTGVIAKKEKTPKMKYGASIEEGKVLATSGHIDEFLSGLQLRKVQREEEPKNLLPLKSHLECEKSKTLLPSSPTKEDSEYLEYKRHLIKKQKAYQLEIDRHANPGQWCHTRSAIGHFSYTDNSGNFKGDNYWTGRCMLEKK
jgi:hypothetical protein